MISKIISYLKNSEAFTANYTLALSHLYKSGVLEALRTLGRVQPVNNMSINYLAEQTEQAAFSRGYNKALDDLLYFRELYIDSKEEPSKLRADFGGFDDAINKGLLTETEADELRGNQTD